MHALEDLSYVLEDMIEPIAKKQDISPTELDNVYKAVKTMNYIETIKAMKDYGKSNEGSYRGSYNSYEGTSNRGSYNSYEGGGSNRGSYEGNSRDGGASNRYSEDGSYRRGRDAMGRFTSRDGMSRDGYSRHEEKEQMISKLERMMQSATSENERQTIMECIRKIED